MASSTSRIALVSVLRSSAETLVVNSNARKETIGFAAELGMKVIARSSPMLPLNALTCAMCAEERRRGEVSLLLVH